MTLQLDSQRRWTYDDYLRLPDDGRRYEIIEGVLYMSPAPLTLHQLTSGRLHHFFFQFQLEGLGFVYSALTDLLMPGCDPVQPDLIFLRREQRPLIQERGIEGVPHLLVEILSPSNPSYDTVKKLNIYAKNGVPLYLIVNPQDPAFQVFRWDEGAYRLEHSLTVGDRWEFEGRTLDLTALFAPLPED